MDILLKRFHSYFLDSSWRIPHGYQRIRRENTNEKGSSFIMVNNSGMQS